MLQLRIIFYHLNRVLKKKKVLWVIIQMLLGIYAQKLLWF